MAGTVPHVVRQKKGGTYVLQNPDMSLYHREPPRDHLKVIDAKADINFDDVFYIEKILDHQGTPANRRYLIKWLNYPSSENTWEPRENLIGSETLLQDYWKTRGNAAKSAAKINLTVVSANSQKITLRKTRA